MEDTFLAELHRRPRHKLPKSTGWLVILCYRFLINVLAPIVHALSIQYLYNHPIYYFFNNEFTHLLLWQRSKVVCVETTIEGQKSSLKSLQTFLRSLCCTWRCPRCRGSPQSNLTSWPNDQTKMITVSYFSPVAMVVQEGQLMEGNIGWTYSARTPSERKEEKLGRSEGGIRET